MSGCCANCGCMTCECRTEQAPFCNLVSSLTSTVDCIRNIATELGARPYQVRLVWTRWTGGKRGEGLEEIVREEAILPTPLVADLQGISLQVQAIGVVESGDVKVTEISPRFTEDYLSGRGADGTPIPKDQNFYWEVRSTRPDQLQARRRFRLSAAPTLDAENFQWKATLTKVAEDRMRNGGVRG